MIAIIQSCGNNLASIQYALARLGLSSVLTNDIETIQTASYVILPGVGQAQTALQQLQQHNLIEVIKTLRQPVLGICLGMQLLYESSEEGNVDCLGIIPGRIQRIRVELGQPVPHMGWNTLTWLKSDSALTSPADNQQYVYFVHSYAAAVNDSTIATSRYGQDFSAIVKHNNFIGMQCHPEKSAMVGQRLLQAFIAGDLS